MKLRSYKNTLVDANALEEFHSRIDRKEPRLNGPQIIEFFDEVSKSCFHHCLLVEKDNQIVAWLLISTPWWNASDDFVLVFLDVDPAHRKKGIGDLLVQQTHQIMQTHHLDEVSVKIYENDEHSVRFALKYGLIPVMKFIDSEFDLNNEIASDVLAELGSKGIDFIDGVELEKSYPNDWQERWCQLHNLVANDIPSVDEWEDQPLEDFIRMNITNSRFDPLNWYFARYKEALIGCTGLTVYGGDETVAFVDITGVVPRFRRQGIARALKIRSLIAAQHRDLKLVRTSNEIDNPMWKLNQSLGFYESNKTALYRGRICF